MLNPFEDAHLGKDLLSRYHEKNIATFPAFLIAARTMKNLYEYKTYLEKTNR